MRRTDQKQQHGSIRLEKQHVATVVILAVLGLTGAFYAGLTIGLRSQVPETPVTEESSSALLPVADQFKMPEATFTYDQALTAKGLGTAADTPRSTIPEAAIAAAETARKAPPRKLDDADTTPKESEMPTTKVSLPGLVLALKQQAQKPSEPSAEEADKPLEYSLQIKAFRSEADAIALSEQLRENGYEAWISKTESQEKGTWYRVRIGMFKTAAEAQKYQKIFEAKEGITTLVSTH